MKVEKSVMVIARQTVSHVYMSTVAMVEVMETVKGSALLKTVRLRKIWEGPISDAERFLMN
jgi:hypothetical protein